VSTHRIIATRTGEVAGMDWETDYEITFAYRKGSPDYWNRAGGHWEQGWAPEIEFISARPLIGIVENKFTQKDIDDWCETWLKENRDKALSEVYAGMDAR
jgi:hypothetical protein